jgi:hypothetical protein
LICADLRKSAAKLALLSQFLLSSVVSPEADVGFAVAFGVGFAFTKY